MEADATQPADTKPCPFCGERIQAAARKCRFCGEYLDPSARPKAEFDPSMKLLVPVGRAPSAIAAGYLGLFALFPCIGLPAGVAAIVAGVVAMRKLKAEPELSGRGRAIFGIVAGGLSVAAHLVTLAIVGIGTLVQG